MAEEFGVRSGFAGLPTSTGDWDEGAARRALDAWAGDDMAKYGRAFLWSDGSDNKSGFKFPIAMPVDGKLTVFLHAVNNAKSRLSSASIPAGDKKTILGILNRLQSSYNRSDEDEEEYTVDVETLVAAAAPVYPPKVWFSRHPNTPAGTRTVVEDNGRAYGRLATWQGCHRTFANTCVHPPRSMRNYADIHTGTTKTAEGDILETGVITVDTGHADTSWSLASKVKAHYDDTGTAVVAARFGEDADGIWWAGVTLPGITEDRVQRLRQSPLSGDWRRNGAGLELIAALGVNTPGFTASVDEDGTIEWPQGWEFSEDSEILVHFEQGELTCLIASFAPSGAEFETKTEDPIGDVSVDDGCGCPDVKAKVATLQPLPTREEVKKRSSLLSGYEML